MSEKAAQVSSKVEINVFPGGSMFLRRELGSGEIEGVPFTMFQSLSGTSTMIQFEGSEWYVFDAKELVKAAFAARNETNDTGECDEREAEK